MVLIDTHVWLWFLQDDLRLKGRIRELVTNRPSEVFLSSVVVWEAATLAQAGRVTFGNRPLAAVRGQALATDFVPIGIDFQIAMLSRELPFEHEDPADRFLAATAKALDIPLATVDERLIRLPWLKTIS